MNKIPDLRGFWKFEASVIRRKNEFEVPDINNVISVSDNFCEMTQNNEFVVLELPPNVLRPNPGYLLGTLTKTFIGTSHKDYFWTLTFSDYDDNGVLTYTISDVACDGTVLEFQGHYTEAGFSVISPNQLQTAGIAKLKRELLTK